MTTGRHRCGMPIGRNMKSRCGISKEWLDEAKAKGIRKTFIIFHYPVLARAGLGPIPFAVNPHKFIASYAKDMEMVVFHGHVHTTEMYDVDGVKYLLLGGGGAEQDRILPGRTSNKVPADYPPDLYWKGEPPKEENVEPGQKTKFTLSRFRPWSAEPFATVELTYGHVPFSRCWRPSLGFVAPAMYWYGWTATAAIGALTLGLVATFLPEQWTRRIWLGWLRLVPVSAMVACVYLTMPLFRLQPYPSWGIKVVSHHQG
jgi:hypothetical protein